MYTLVLDMPHIYVDMPLRKKEKGMYTLVLDMPHIYVRVRSEQSIPSVVT